jgi:YebC/PmpR family DNA-binding regulatory protein
MLIECLTDNKNRTVADIKHIFDRFGGSLGAPGCVAWMFEKRGMVLFEKEKVDEEVLIDVALEAGAKDVKEEETEFVVITAPSDFEKVKKAFDNRGMAYSVAEIGMVPQNTVRLEGKKAEQMLKLMDAFEDNDDVNNVYANFDIPDEVMEAIS